MKWPAIFGMRIAGHFTTGRPFFYSRLQRTAYFFVCSKLQFCEMAGHWPSKNGRPFFPEKWTVKTVCFLFVVNGRPLALQKLAGHFFQEMAQTSKNALPLISPMLISRK